MLPQALQGDPLPVVSLQREIFLNDYQNIFSLPTMDNRTLKGLIASVGCSMEFYLKILKEIKVKMRITVFQPMDLGEKFKKC